MLAAAPTSQADADLALTTALAAALLPHFQAALVSTAEDNEAALALDSMKRCVKSPVMIPPQPLLVAPSLPPGAVPRYTIRRVITCATYLRRLHVTGEMANNLLPDMNEHVPPAAMRHQSNQSFFKRGIDLVDTSGGVHKLTYECLVSAGQRHARLSAGWGPAMRNLKARIGDTVFLHLYGDRNDGVLHVRLERDVERERMKQMRTD